MKFGFEREFFLVPRGMLGGSDCAVVPGELSSYADSVGWLVEARGAPHDNAIDAAFLLQGAEWRLKNAVKDARLKLLSADRAWVSWAVQQQARRRFAKERTRYRNMYNNEAEPLEHKPDGSLRALAGLHVHFSNDSTVPTRYGTTTTHTPMDMPAIIGLQDEQ